jgi:hypothetical protein
MKYRGMVKSLWYLLMAYILLYTNNTILFAFFSGLQDQIKDVFRRRSQENILVKQGITYLRNSKKREEKGEREREDGSRRSV